MVKQIKDYKLPRHREVNKDNQMLEQLKSLSKLQTKKPIIKSPKTKNNIKEYIEKISKKKRH